MSDVGAADGLRDRAFYPGPTQYQVRRWTPWHRHVTTVMLALAFLAVTQAALPPDIDEPSDQGKDQRARPKPP
ncbi:SRSO17 transposase [Streptosporangium album]|uniref:SRSO17 transposase n=1 Tax=Streptosporangium album TaxID=47479 RepID=A0A7W7RPK3_9ACTN|nr:hypothetical protein [Streptosporangium album]MBB4935781.1 SRSO17 transposase [Streptosporangium album]